MKMKIKMICLITGILFLISAAFGINCRKTFTHFDKLEYFNIGELPGRIIPNFLKRESKVLEKSKYILKIAPLKGMEFDSLCTKQKVKVVKVFRGTDVKVGDEFYAIKADASLTCTEPRDTNMNFVNELKEGQEYLAFFERKIKTSAVFFITPPTTIPPFYSYKDRSNVIITIPKNAESTYVPYEKVKDNEFFVTDKKGLDNLNTFKKRMTEKYE